MSVVVECVTANCGFKSGLAGDASRHVAEKPYHKVQTTAVPTCLICEDDVPELHVQFVDSMNQRFGHLCQRHGSEMIDKWNANLK